MAADDRDHVEDAVRLIITLRPRSAALVRHLYAIDAEAIREIHSRLIRDKRPDRTEEPPLRRGLFCAVTCVFV